MSALRVYGDGAATPAPIVPPERRTATLGEEVLLLVIRNIGEREAAERLLLCGRYRSLFWDRTAGRESRR